MNDYIAGIAYGTGCIVKEGGNEFLFIRNLDPYYAKLIESEVPYMAYQSKHNIDRDGRTQWCIKARNIHKLPELSEINNPDDFIRAYMELHAAVDLVNAKSKKGNNIKKLRIRIYGSEKILSFINDHLPAGKKKLQYIKNVVDANYIGRTCCIYYQSQREIYNILDWIDGDPRNEKVWDTWQKIMALKQL